MEDEEDEEEDEVIRRYYDGEHTDTEKSPDRSGEERSGRDHPGLPHEDRDKSEERGKYAWYNEQFPPLAMWVAGNDDLVDGRRLLRRFDRGREPHVNVVHKKIIEGYEHLDVIWAMDVIEKVGREVKDVIWATVSEEARMQCRTPVGCEDKPEDQEKSSDDLADSFHDERSSRRMDVDVSKANADSKNLGPVSPTQVDTTAGEWSRDLRHDREEAKSNAGEEG